MTEDQRILEATVRDILTDHSAPAQVSEAAGRLDRSLWDVFESAGLTLVGTPEDAGGSGGGIEDVAVLLRLAGEFCAPIPLAEAGWMGSGLLAAAGIPLPEGVLTVGIGSTTAAKTGSNWRVTGLLRRVAYGGDADWITGLASVAGEPVVFLAPLDNADVTAGANLAREPRDDIALNIVIPGHAVAGAPVDQQHLMMRGALSRALLIAGATEAVLAQTLTYAEQRVQFGRPIAAFQAIQQHVAQLAGEVLAARAAADGAVTAMVSGSSTDRLIAVAAAKIRTAQAAGTVASIAHQVHGAIGMTEEHPLRLSTMRLWSWREEWGSEALWAQTLTHAIAASGGRGMWPALTGQMTVADTALIV
jgi:acyl-CoA dehydrogenase